MPEEMKKSGCGCGGCLLFAFYSLVLLLCGMYLSSLIAQDWDFNKAKDTVIDDSLEIGNLLKNKATQLITGEEVADSVDKLSPAKLREYKDLRLLGDNSYDKAMDLLKKARNASGAKRQEILREVQKEFQTALAKYKQAAQIIGNSEENLEKKMDHISELLKRMVPEK